MLEVNQIYNMDCLEGMKMLPDKSVDMVLTDPPYFRVKSEAWDRQWKNTEKYLEWIHALCFQWKRILKPNGSLYVFASPELSAHVEVTIARTFHVLNRIRWIKDAGWHNKTSKESLRKFLSPWEEIIFAEQNGADGEANTETGWGAKCDSLHKSVYSVLGARIQKRRTEAGFTRGQVDTECSPSKKPTGLCYRWEAGDCLPTEEQYIAFLELCGDRREYEELRREYAELRRPFAVSAHIPFTDVWHFTPVSAYPGKHPCEKPLELLEHIIITSTKPGALILDCCIGSGATAEACRDTNRNFLGFDTDPHWCEFSKRRIEAEQAQLRLAI